LVWDWERIQDKAGAELTDAAVAALPLDACHRLLKQLRMLLERTPVDVRKVSDAELQM